MEKYGDFCKRCARCEPSNDLDFMGREQVVASWRLAGGWIELACIGMAEEGAANHGTVDRRRNVLEGPVFVDQADHADAQHGF